MDTVILDRLRAAAPRRLAPHGVIAAYAFGSRISGEARPASDLDVGYYLRNREALPIRDEMLLASQLSDDTGHTVDLRNLGRAPLELRGRVLEEGIRIYSGDDVQRVDLECDILARYHDYKAIFREMHSLRLRIIAERGL